jgi:hypothetical protein
MFPNTTVILPSTPHVIHHVFFFMKDFYPLTYFREEAAWVILCLFALLCCLNHLLLALGGCADYKPNTWLSLLLLTQYPAGQKDT